MIRSRFSLPQKTPLPGLTGIENTTTSSRRSRHERLHPQVLASPKAHAALFLAVLSLSSMPKSIFAGPAAQVTKLTCVRASLTGTLSDACTVSLSAPAPATALKVALSSSHKSWVMVPASVVVAAGATSGSFIAAVNYSQLTDGSVTLTAKGNGSTKSFALNLLASTRALSVNTTALSFGTLPVNTATTMPLTLTSSGNLPVTISGAVLSGAGFTLAVGPLPQTLNPGQSLTLNAQFWPADTTAAAGQIVVSTNANVGASNLTVSLSGRGTTSAKLTLSTTSISFGSVSVGSSATQEVVVTSTGTAPVTLSSASLTGAGFDAASSVSLPVILSPGQSVIGYMTFQPTSTGSATAALTIASNSTTPSLVVTLTGSGASATHVVNLAWDAPASSPVPVAGYHVYRAAASDSSYVLLTPSQNAQTTYSDSSVQIGQSYSYVVKSVDSAGDESPASNSTTVTIP